MPNLWGQRQVRKQAPEVEEGLRIPVVLVPIQTEHGEDLSHIFANVITLNDGEVFDLA